jgi:lysophospholipase L1-like esterase
MSRTLPILFAAAALAACGSSNATTIPDGGGGGSVDAHHGGGGDGGLLCQATPARMVVLGDSIASCYGVGDASGADCGYNQFHGYLAGHYADGVTYENDAVPGAVAQDVPDQMTGVAGGPGHVLVVVQVGGNNLAPYMFQSDQQAEQGYGHELPLVQGAWEQLFTYFDDASKFPEGATIFVSNQYDPFDDCTAAPYNLSAKKIELLHAYNDAIAAIADAHDNAVLVDQFTSFLGHGHHFDVAACPYYMAGAEGWMNDLIHPNAAGHAHLAEVLDGVADQVYGDCQ